MDSLKLEARKLQHGAGIYDAGDTDKCYCKLFVTESGRVIPVNQRIITEDDLLQAYSWGWEDAKASTAVPALPDEAESDGR